MSECLAEDSSSAKAETKPFSKTRLRKHLQAFRVQLQQRHSLVQQYQSLLTDSDFFRIVNFNQNQEDQKLLED